MTTNRRRRQRGSTMVEFTLVGVGLIFVLISIFEMARGMWIYHTLAHASKEATRFLVVHGKECQTQGTTCVGEATLGTLASRIQYHGVGLVPSQLDVQVYRISGTTETQVVGSGGGFVKLSTLTSSTAVWDSNAILGDSVRVALRYPFTSALAMFWPGAGRVRFGQINLGANSWDVIQF